MSLAVLQSTGLSEVGCCKRIDSVAVFSLPFIHLQLLIDFAFGKEWYERAANECFIAGKCSIVFPTLLGTLFAAPPFVRLWEIHWFSPRPVVMEKLAETRLLARRRLAQRDYNSVRLLGSALRLCIHPCIHTNGCV